MEVEAVRNSTYSPCGRKATLNMNNMKHSELRSCVKVEAAVRGSPSLTDLMVYVDTKKH